MIESMPEELITLLNRGRYVLLRIQRINMQG